MSLHSVVSSGVWLIPEQKQQELFPLPFGAKKAASFQKTFQKQCLQQNTFAQISSTTWNRVITQRQEWDGAYPMPF